MAVAEILNVSIVFDLILQQQFNHFFIALTPANV